MTRPGLPGAILVIFLLSLTSFLHSTPSIAAIRKNNPRDLTQLSLTPEHRPTEDQKIHYRSNGGNDIIHEIWSVLRDFEPTWKDSVTTSSSSGLAGKGWYYSKIVLKTLFMNSPTRDEYNAGSDTQVRGDLKNAVDTLTIGAAHDDQDALFLLAEMNFYGNFSYPRNHGEAFHWYQQLANLNGNSTAQFMLGLMYATGVGGSIERDQAKALIYYTLAARQGEIKAEMTLGHRYHRGIGCDWSCNKAADFYRRVADRAMDYWQSGPPGGHALQRNAVRWVEYAGGSYGEGASMSSSGPNAMKDGTISTNLDDVLEYLDMQERQGNWNAVLTLGKHYYEAPRGYKRDLRKAQRQFMKIARSYWGKDGKVNPKAPKNIEKTAAKAAAYIGRMFLRGEGMEQNFEKAITWFRRGVSEGDAFAQYHLGLMYRDGLGLPKDGYRAATYLNAAAEQSLALAQSALGVLFLDQGDVETAGRYFELAAGAGVMESYYYLAELTNKGIGRERNCGLSVAYYKIVVEKAELLHSSFTEANSAYERGDLERAFIASIIAAEQGYENAQANVAFLLDQRHSLITLPSIPLLSHPLSPISSTGVKRSKLLNDPSLALVYFTRSAMQANVDSLIKMGDYYLTGIDPESLVKVNSSSSPDNKHNTEFVTRNLDKASTCYTTAAESHHSAQALWNLGWMHENGLGPIVQDFHMAKRYYDLALEMNKEAYFPVKLALLKLRARSWWNGISGGKVNPISDYDSEKDKRPKTFWEWLNRFLDAAEEMDAQEYAEHQRQARGGDAAAAADFADDAYGDTGMPGGDADYWYDPARQDGDGEFYADIDDGLVESLIIIALAGALAMLVCARQHRQREGRDREERERREREGQQPAVVAQGQQPAPFPAPAPAQGQPQAAGAGQNGGFFPNPAEPEFANWVAGGIGH